MEKLDKVIAALEQCHRDVKYRDCDRCGYAEAGSECEQCLMEDALEVLKTLSEDVIDQSGTILYLNRDLERCRKALNAQGEYAYLGGDLISREALRERIEEIDWHSTNADGVLHSGAADEESAYVRYADVARAVEAAAAVEAEPVVHAHWIENEDELGLCDECSACHIETCGKSPRCPVCGAHMDEEVADGT